MTWRKGDILEGSDRRRDAALHYIVFLEPQKPSYFIGAMLTRSARYMNNVLMSEEHFERTTDEGGEYKFRFDNTHLVKGKFIKLESWGPFKKIGELTGVGIEFVDAETSTAEPELWEEYERRV